ncbi:hypothetical protein SS7213T_03195, partial [Staphylococcus simiae CCM 7213 = CCUG 51256]
DGEASATPYIIIIAVTTIVLVILQLLNYRIFKAL